MESIVKWKLDEDVICEEIHGVNVLMSAQKGLRSRPFVQEINEYGAFCWKVLEKERDINHVIRIIGAKYNISEEVVRENLFSFMKVLQEKKYIELNDEYGHT